MIRVSERLGRCEVRKEIVVTKDNAASVLRMIRDGYTVKWMDRSESRTETIGGTPVQRVRRRRRRAPNVTPETVAAMVQLRKKGLAHRIIARRVGLSLTATGNHIRKAMKKEGK